MKKSFELYFLWILLFVLSINGIMGGGMLMLKPDGSLLQMQDGWLAKTPFPDFFIPGLFLFLMNGIFPFITFWGLLSKKEIRAFNAINIYKEKHWSWTFAIYSGVTTISWIIIQQLITDYFILQPIITALGLLILISALLPGIQKWYTK